MSPAQAAALVEAVEASEGSVVAAVVTTEAVAAPAPAEAAVVATEA